MREIITIQQEDNVRLLAFISCIGLWLLCFLLFLLIRNIQDTIEAPNYTLRAMYCCSCQVRQTAYIDEDHAAVICLLKKVQVQCNASLDIF